jgi:hypothetical protein
MPRWLDEMVSQLCSDLTDLVVFVLMPTGGGKSLTCEYNHKLAGVQK